VELARVLNLKHDEQCLTGYFLLTVVGISHMLFLSFPSMAPPPGLADGDEDSAATLLLSFLLLYGLVAVPPLVIVLAVRGL